VAAVKGGLDVSAVEGLNVPKSSLRDFFNDLEGRLSLITGLVDMEEIGLNLKEVRKPLLVIGLPGIGKTAGIIGMIKKMNERLPEEKQLGFKKSLLGQTVVGSMSGIPVVMPDGSITRVQVPDLPDEERDGKYGVFFLDEITTADEAQVQPALGLCDDSRNIGTYTLPEHWIVVAAGNGPESTNFIRLDDMTISRFTVYDIAYDYKKDWRSYAYETNVDGDIIAFLNFSPDTCVRVESTDMDNAGKLCPNPRTWERLSGELKIRRAINKPVGQLDLGNFAGRIIGSKAGREFMAFCKYKDKVTYDAEKICNGLERDPELIEKQVFFLLLENCIKYLEGYLNKVEEFDDTCFVMTSNFLSWFLKFERFDLENVINTIIEIKHQTKLISEVIKDMRFYEFCPALATFLEENVDYILENTIMLGLGDE